jgi:hypothetical protein
MPYLLQVSAVYVNALMIQVALAIRISDTLGQDLDAEKATSAGLIGPALVGNTGNVGKPTCGISERARTRPRPAGQSRAEAVFQARERGPAYPEPALFHPE